MSNDSNMVVGGLADNPRIIAFAGGLLFFLGLVAAFLAWATDDSDRKVTLVLSTAVLMSMGYPALLYVRALQKIATLERRIQALESMVVHRS
jgi:uncharacterized protein involved in exopolysaccharide biosynthesis